MRRIVFCSHPIRPKRRGGTTLTEVLMSIMLMGIGVVTVASLFPIAILRSAKATQLTQATILRMNAESMIEIMPQLVRDPDGDDDFLEHNDTNYIVDPFGWTVLNEAGSSFTSTFGNDGSAASPAAPTRFNGSPSRFTPAVAGVSAAVAAERGSRFVTLPDTWTVQTDGIPSAVTTTSVTLPSNVNLTIPWGTPASRITLFDNTGRRSETHTITDITGQTITWSGSLVLATTSIERVRIETESRRYTWLLTVRMSSAGLPNVDVVVFFNRSVDQPERDERVVNDVTDTSSGTQPNRYTINVSSVPSDERPLLKRGGFMFDPDEARWYRILRVEDEYSTSPSVTLDMPSPPLQPITRAIFPRGIVDVYPLGDKGLVL